MCLDLFQPYYSNFLFIVPLICFFSALSLPSTGQMIFICTFFPLTGLEVNLFIYFFGPILLLAFNSFYLIQFLP